MMHPASFRYLGPSGAEEHRIEVTDLVGCLWWIRRRVRVARGNCTVWHWEPSGVRCGTEMESRLSEVWTRHVKWRRA